MPRYFDAELVKKELNRGNANIGLFNYLIAVIESTPAADVEEVKHGERVEDSMIGEGVYRCTNCDDKFVTLEGTPYDNRLFYCPFCGAKMDGKENEDD